MMVGDVCQLSRAACRVAVAVPSVTIVARSGRPRKRIKEGLGFRALEGASDPQAVPLLKGARMVFAALALSLSPFVVAQVERWQFVVENGLTLPVVVRTRGACSTNSFTGEAF